jgi:hypothetical protein
VAQSYYARVPQLPESVRRDVLRLVEHADQILKFLEETATEKPTAAAGKFSRLLAQRLSITAAEAGRLLQVLPNLQFINQETGDHEKTFAIIADRLPADERQKWVSAKAAILSMLAFIDADHPVVISQKARRLSYLYERIFVNAEIITDLRPVYTVKGDKILEMIIQHKLIIRQHDSSHTDSDLHLVMDARDIINLKNACERAIQKAKVLQDALANLPWVTEILSDDEQT